MKYKKVKARLLDAIDQALYRFEGSYDFWKAVGTQEFNEHARNNSGPDFVDKTDEEWGQYFEEHNEEHGLTIMFLDNLRGHTEDASTKSEFILGVLEALSILDISE